MSASPGSFQDLVEPIVEIGPGVGANFRYLAPGSHVIAVEPNPHLHEGLRAAADKHGLELDLRTVLGERLDVEDASAGSVITTLVLCTMTNPEAALGEVHRVARPGGRSAVLEHVVDPDRTLTRRVQRVVARPWTWVFERCSWERDLAPLINQTVFSEVDKQHTQLRSPDIPANTQLAGTAIK